MKKNYQMYLIGASVAALVVPVAAVSEVKAENIQSLVVVTEKSLENTQQITQQIPGFGKLIKVTSNTGTVEVVSVVGEEVTVKLNGGNAVERKLTGGELLPADSKYIENYSSANYDVDNYKGTLEQYKVSGELTEGEEVLTEETSEIKDYGNGAIPNVKLDFDDTIIYSSYKTEREAIFESHRTELIGKDITEDGVKYKIIDVKFKANGIFPSISIDPPTNEDEDDEDDWWNEVTTTQDTASTNNNQNNALSNKTTTVTYNFDVVVQKYTKMPDIDTRVFAYRGEVSRPEIDTRTYEDFYQYEVTFQYDKKEDSPVVVPPVVDPTPPVVDPTPPVVDPTPPVVDPTPPVVDPTPPVVEPTPSVDEPTDEIEEIEDTNEQSNSNAVDLDNYPGLEVTESDNVNGQFDTSAVTISTVAATAAPTMYTQNRLPQTNGENSPLMVGLGLLLVGIGMLLNKRRRINKSM